MEMHGCELDYHLPAQKEGSYFQGTFDIVCPGPNVITFQPVSSKACLVTVPAQTGLPASFRNVGSGSERKVEVETAFMGGLKYSQASGPSCETTGTFTNGGWGSRWTLQASQEGNPVGMYVGNNPISISGTPPKLTAESYPVRLGGEQTTVGTIKMQPGTAKCTTAKFNSSASSSTAQLAVEAEYGGCTTFGLPSAINMNGCTYTFNILNQAPVGSTYAGHADIACPVGAAIEILVYTSSSNHKVQCTVTIPGQTTDSEGLTFTNEPSSTIALGLAIKGIDYHTQEGSGLARCSTADYTDGTYTVPITLVGL
ncbi:MAG: hypothetical protein WA862_09895 [Solirubrobacterales bacterium]